MKLFLGVDGGQSSTTAVIGDEQGRVLGLGRSGPCNHVKTGDGREKFLNAVSGSVRGALDQAGLPLDTRTFHSACLGFSGGPADKEALVREMIDAETMFVTTDALIALAGATAGDAGIITIAGTGSISYGRNVQGRMRRAGGWGYIYGDEGGGFDITRRALRACLRMEEGWGTPTMLVEMLLQATGLADINTVMHKFYTVDYPRPQIASYSKLVDQAAGQGDDVAIGILKDAAAELAGYTHAVRRSLFTEREAVLVSPIGSVYKSSILLGEFEKLVTNAPNVTFHQPTYGPGLGALLEAYRIANMRVTLSQVPAAEK